MPWIRTGNFVECSEVLWYALFLKRAKGYNRSAFRFSGEKLTLGCACSSNHSFASFDVLFHGLDPSSKVRSCAPVFLYKKGIFQLAKYVVRQKIFQWLRPWIPSSFSSLSTYSNETL